MRRKNITDIEIRNSPISGQGLFAKRAFHVGEMLLEWQPIREISRDELSRCSPEDMHYILPISEDTFILMGEPERFMNHSCDPNTETRGQSDYVIREIAVGEEITSDYSVGNTLVGFKCRCGKPNCRSVILK